MNVFGLIGLVSVMTKQLEAQLLLGACWVLFATLCACASAIGSEMTSVFKYKLFTKPVNKKLSSQAIEDEQEMQWVNYKDNDKLSYEETI